MTGAPGKNDCDYCGASTGHYNGCPEGVSALPRNRPEVFMPPFRLNSTPPPPQTFDAYVLGSIAEQGRTYPRRTAKVAVQVALVQAEKRGYQIPDSLKAFA